MKFSLLSRKSTVEPAVQYRRFRMELDLRTAKLPVPQLPEHVDWSPWDPELAPIHAIVLFEGFRGGIDSRLLPSLSSLESCSELVRQTYLHHRFISEGTWLLSARNARTAQIIPCGTVQALGMPGGMARIQNLAVLGEFRGQGLGRALLFKALRQFRWLGLERAELDVTESNEAAVKLYRSAGFRVRRVFYRNLD